MWLYLEAHIGRSIIDRIIDLKKEGVLESKESHYPWYFECDEAVAYKYYLGDKCVAQIDYCRFGTLGVYINLEHIEDVFGKNADLVNKPS